MKKRLITGRLSYSCKIKYFKVLYIWIFYPLRVIPSVCSRNRSSASILMHLQLITILYRRYYHDTLYLCVCQALFMPKKNKEGGDVYMFALADNKRIDRQHFDVLLFSTHHIILRSKDTKHIWDLTKCELFWGDSRITVYHKHHPEDAFHYQRGFDSKTITQAQAKIIAHDKWHRSGRKRSSVTHPRYLLCDQTPSYSESPSKSSFLYL